MLIQRLLLTSLLLALSVTLSAGAEPSRSLHFQTPAVFVQTNKALGNPIQVFARAAEGTLGVLALWRGPVRTRRGGGGGLRPTPLATRWPRKAHSSIGTGSFLQSMPAAIR